MDDREPSERAHLHRLHETPRARSRVETSDGRLDFEAREKLDEPQQRLLVCERDAPVCRRVAESVAPPARLVAERPIAERHPGEVADAIVVVEVLDDDRRVAEPAAGGELSGFRPAKIPSLQPAVLRGGDDLRPLGDEAQRRASRPPHRLDHRGPELSRPSGLREFVEAEEDVADAHRADRPPRHVSVQNLRLGPCAINAAVLTTSVRVQAEAEADVGAVVLGQDRAARVAVEDGGRRRGVAVGVGLELDVERLVAVRGIRRGPPAGEVRTRHRGRL